jgi:hypothetical protein
VEIISVFFEGDGKVEREKLRRSGKNSSILHLLAALTETLNLQIGSLNSQAFENKRSEKCEAKSRSQTSHFVIKVFL